MIRRNIINTAFFFWRCKFEFRLPCVFFFFNISLFSIPVFFRTQACLIRHNLVLFS